MARVAPAAGRRPACGLRSAAGGICWTPSCWGCHCGGGGGAAILARSVRAPRCDAGGCRLRVWTVNLRPTALKLRSFHGGDYADYAVVHSRFKRRRAFAPPLSPRASRLTARADPLKCGRAARGRRGARAALRNPPPPPLPPSRRTAIPSSAPARLPEQRASRPRRPARAPRSLRLRRPGLAPAGLAPRPIPRRCRAACGRCSPRRRVSAAAAAPSSIACHRSLNSTNTFSTTLTICSSSRVTRSSDNGVEVAGALDAAISTTSQLVLGAASVERDKDLGAWPSRGRFRQPCRPRRSTGRR